MKVRPDTPSKCRAILGGAAVAGAAIISAPYVRNAEAPKTTTWKVQTSWPAGVGLNTFKTWAGSIKEKTGGELEFKPFAAKEVVGDFELLDGVKNGVLEAMNSFTRLLGRQSAGDGVPVVVSDGPALSARMGRVLLLEGRAQDGARDLRQAKPHVCGAHPSRPEHHPLEKADPLDRGLQGPQAARSRRHDRRRLRGNRRQDHPAAWWRGVLGAGEGHHRGGRLHRPGGQLGSRVPRSPSTSGWGPSGTRIHLSASRLDGFLRRHESLE